MSTHRKAVVVLREAYEALDACPDPDPEQWEIQDLIWVKVIEIAKTARSVIADVHTDTEVEPGPERRASLIDERVVDGVRVSIDGPKGVEKSEVVS